MNFWLTVWTGISDLELVFGSHSSPLFKSEAALLFKNPMDEGAEDDAVGFAKNVSRHTMCVPNAWRLLSTARHSYRTA